MYFEYKAIKDFINVLPQTSIINTISMAQLLNALNSLELNRENMNINNLVGYKFKFAQMLHDYITKLQQKNLIKALNFDNFLEYLLKNYGKQTKEEQTITNSLFNLRKACFGTEELERCFNDYMVIEDSDGTFAIEDKTTNTKIYDDELTKKIAFSNVWFASFVNTTGSFEYGFDAKSARIYKLVFEAIESQLTTSGDIDVSKLEKYCDNRIYQSIINNLFYDNYRRNISESYFRIAVLKPKEGKIKSELEDFGGTTALIIDAETMDTIMGKSTPELVRAF